MSVSGLTNSSWLCSKVVQRGTALSDSTPLASEHRLVMLELKLAERFMQVKEHESSGVSTLFILVVFLLDVQADDDIFISPEAAAASKLVEAAFVMIVGNFILAIDFSVFFTAGPAAFGSCSSGFILFYWTQARPGVLVGDNGS